MKIDAALLETDMSRVAQGCRGLEEAGFDGCFTFEGPYEPFMRLLLAAEHSDLEVGTGVAIAFARTPMVVAQLAHDLQHYSGGRFWLGLGSQIRPHVEARYGMPWGKPVARMKEFVQALRAIWACWNDGAPLDFRGEFYTHTLMPPLFKPVPARGGAPKIYLGGVGPKMTEAAGEVADGMLVHPFHTQQSLREITLPALMRGLRASGRKRESFELCVQTIVVTGRNDEELERASEMARSQLAFYASTPAYRAVLETEGYGELQPRLRAMTKAGQWSEMARQIDDALLQKVVAMGAPAKVAAILGRRYRTSASRLAFASPFPIPTECATEIVRALRSGPDPT